MSNRTAKNQKKRISGLSKDLVPNIGDMISWHNPDGGDVTLVNNKPFSEQMYGLTFEEAVREEEKVIPVTTYAYLGDGAIKAVFRLMIRHEQGVINLEDGEDAIALQTDNRSALRTVDQEDYDALEQHLIIGEEAVKYCDKA